MTMAERDKRTRARARIAHDPISRLTWLLDFVQSEALGDLSVLSLEEFKQEMSIFARDAGYLTATVPDEPITSRQDLEDLARMVRSGIRAYLSGKSWTLNSEDLGKFSESVGRPSKARGGSGARPPKPGETPRRTWMGEPRAAFLKACFDLVATEGQRIRECGLVDCRRLFAAVKRQSFCSALCSGRARTARWLAKQPKERLSKLRHDRYERGKTNG